VLCCVLCVQFGVGGLIAQVLKVQKKVGNIIETVTGGEGGLRCA